MDNNKMYLTEIRYNSVNCIKMAQEMANYSEQGD